MTVYHEETNIYFASYMLVLAGTFLRLFSTAKHQLKLKLRVVSLLAKPLCSLSYDNITLLESDHDVVGYQVSDLISEDIRTVDLASDWLIANLGTVMVDITLASGSKSSGSSRCQYRCGAFSRRKFKQVRRLNDEYAAGELLGKPDRMLESKLQWLALHPSGNSYTLNQFICRNLNFISSTRLTSLID